MSQAYIGYQLQESLLNELHALNIDKQVVTLVTQVEVAGDDQAFNNPTNQLAYSIQKNKRNKQWKKRLQICRRLWTRLSSCVPSPMPINIVELDSIETLIKHGTLVIAAGGGIPVVKEEGNYKGVDAVIDKDKTSALLAALKIRSINHLNSSRLCLY